MNEEHVDITQTKVYVKVHKLNAHVLTLNDLPGLTYNNEKIT